MLYLGDFKAGQTVEYAFDSSVDGLPSDVSAVTVAIYKGSSSSTEITTGVTVTTAFDSLTGLAHVTVDLSADGTYYAAGNEFIAIMKTATLNGQTIRRVLFHFSIENRCVNWAKVASPTTTVALSGTTIGVVSSIASGAIAAASFAAGALDAVWSAGTRLLTAGTNIVLAKGTGVTGFTDLSAAQVNSEVVDALNVDTYAEPGQGSPSATTTIAAKIGYLYKFLRNKKTQTSGVLSVFADDGTTVDQKTTTVDDGATYTHGEIVSGP